MAAYAAYKSFWNPSLSDSSYESNRLARYQMAWGFYQNNIYNQLTTYLAATYPTGSQIYKYTKGLRNPIPAWVDFYVTNVWGGQLDLEAGNGQEKPSALPIITENDALRPAIAKLWQWSNWNAKRNLATTYSAALGDTFIVVVDSPRAGKAYMQVRRPSEFTAIDWDDFGHVKRCVIEYKADDEQGKVYDFKQIIEHPSVWGGKFTRYQTYKDNRPFAFPENVLDGMATWEWEVPYDFVPVVHVPFKDVGEDWGALGYSATIPKIDAANSLASLLNSQIGKTVNPAYVAFGIQSGNITVGGSDEGQDEIPILYIPKPPGDASLQPLITQIDLPGALALLDAQLANIAQDLPELRMSEAMRSGLSGEALGRAVRAHWGIENRLHWVLDVGFGEDASTVRKDYAPQNLSLLKKIVLNLVRPVPMGKNGKMSLRMKRKATAWSDEERVRVLSMQEVPARDHGHLAGRLSGCGAGGGAWPLRDRGDGPRSAASPAEGRALPGAGAAGIRPRRSDGLGKGADSPAGAAG